MKCPHCKKEVFEPRADFDVSGLYDIPEELTPEKELEAESKRLMALISNVLNDVSSDHIPNPLLSKLVAALNPRE